MRTLAVGFVLLLVAALAPYAPAAEIGATAQSVLPAGTQQLVSVDYRHLANNPLAQQLESQVLPPQMRNITSLLQTGGVDTTQDLNRLTFATFATNGTLQLLGVAEGNFEAFKTTTFFHATKTQTAPPQYNGVSYYSGNGVIFFLPDPTTLVFGDLNAIHAAIDVEQGTTQALAENSNMVNLMSGTQTTDIWSILDAGGARAMLQALAGSSGKLDTSALAHHFSGARYTIQFDTDVKANLELMTDDAMSAGLASIGLRAAVQYEQYQAKDPALKNLLSQVEVDSAGNDAFLQVQSPQTTVAQLLQTDLFKSMMR